MSKPPVWNFVRTWGMMALGTALYAFGLQYFIIPNTLMEGGVTGISVLLNYIAGIPVSVSTLAINIPLFVAGWRKLGGKAMLMTIAGVLMLSFFLRIFELAVQWNWLVPFATERDFILVVLYAGVTLGAGLGLVFRAGGTTGGVDIVARLLYRAKGWSMGQVILALDVLVLGASLFFIPKEKILYTLVSTFIAARIIDFIQEGAYAAKAFTIISSKPEQLAEVIARELERGVTLVPAVGAWSKEPKTVLYCVVSRYEVRKLKSLVRQHDKRAFIVIGDVHDVLGEGFREE